MGPHTSQALSLLVVARSKMSRWSIFQRKSLHKSIPRNLISQQSSSSLSDALERASCCSRLASYEPVRLLPCVLQMQVFTSYISLRDAKRHFLLACCYHSANIVLRADTCKLHCIRTEKTPIFTARAYARAVLGVVILSVRLSVCLSVTRVDCDKTK